MTYTSSNTRDQLNSPPAKGQFSIDTAANTITYTATEIGSFSYSLYTDKSCGKSDTDIGYITVNGPPAPIAQPDSLVTEYETAASKILTSTGGEATSYVLASSPAHGVAVITGNTLNYTPAGGYSGPDSLTFRATGPGGTSAPATLSITVKPAQKPVAQPATLNVDYGGTVTANMSATGPVTNMAISQNPAHGVAAFSGKAITYTAHDGFWGTDYLYFTATGPGGVSEPALVTVNVKKPDAPVAAPVFINVPYGGSGSGTVSATGIVDGFVLSSAASKGMAVLSGNTINYTANPGVFGSDVLTYVAHGPGGQSAPATISVTIAAPPPPEAVGGTLKIPYGASGTVQVQTAGIVQSLKIAKYPDHGTAAIGGNMLGYTANYGFTGFDTLTVIPVGPAGDGAPVTYTVEVGGPPPPLLGGSMIQVPVGGSVSYEFKGGGEITSFELFKQPGHGQAVLNGSIITYTADPNYEGFDTLQVRAIGPGGASAPASLGITVGRPGMSNSDRPKAKSVGPSPMMQLAASRPVPTAVKRRVVEVPDGQPITVELLYDPAVQIVGAKLHNLPAPTVGTALLGQPRPGAIALTWSPRRNEEPLEVGYTLKTDQGQLVNGVVLLIPKAGRPALPTMPAPAELPMPRLTKVAATKRWGEGGGLAALIRAATRVPEKPAIQRTAGLYFER